MNNMCRLCLSVTSEKICGLSKESDIIGKIKECLCIELLQNEALPSQICNVCVSKIEDIHNYYKKIKDNQEVLLKLTIDKTDNPDENNFVPEKGHSIPNKEYKVSSPFDGESVEEETYSISDDEVLSKSKINNEQQCEIKIKSQTRKKKKTEQLENSKHNLENLQHKCLMCFVDCRSQNELVQHYNEHEEITNKDNETMKTDSDTIKIYKTNTLADGKIIYECSTCCKSYNRVQDILKHVESHQRPFICKLCGPKKALMNVTNTTMGSENIPTSRRASKKLKKRHPRAHHYLTSGRTYRSSYEIVRHGRAHNGVIFHCSFRCGFSTAYKGALRTHEKGHGSPEFKFTCEKCGKGFHVKTWHDQHQNVHSGLKPFTCDICGVAFHMSRYLTSHRSKMHPQTSLIKKHICVICSLPCDTRNSLKRHMEVHGVKSTLLCDLCGKVFANSELLKYHKNSHLGLKPYTCSVCNKKFVKKFNLKMHERTHTGERAHSCPRCGKSFTQCSALRRHEQRYHTKLKLQENIVTDTSAPEK